MWSTTTSRTTPSPTCTASAGPVGPGAVGAALLFVTPRERHLLSAIERATRQKLTETPATVGRGRQCATGGEVPRLDHRPRWPRRESTCSAALIEDYERDNDVPMADIAAALAVQSRDGEEFLMAPSRRRRSVVSGRIDRPRETAATHRTDPRTGDLPHRGRQAAQDRPRLHRGAIANEGGLNRSDFGHITIKPDYSLVELPAKLSRETMKT